jgi:hypothetical protein
MSHIIFIPLPPCHTFLDPSPLSHFFRRLPLLGFSVNSAEVCYIYNIHQSRILKNTTFLKIHFLKKEERHHLDFFKTVTQHRVDYCVKILRWWHVVYLVILVIKVGCRFVAFCNLSNFGSVQFQF